MIQVKGLGFRYPPPFPDATPVTVLNDISFVIEAGARLAVTGPNGCGKTTLCLSLAGLAPRLTGGEIEGQVLVGGYAVQKEPPGSLADVIGLTLQDPTGQLFNATVEGEVAWGLENLGIPAPEMHDRIDRALDAVGLGDIPRQQSPQALSGGQQKRLALASALALQPKVLILDEPSGGLTPAGRREMVSALKRLGQDSELTLVFTESDPQVITELADVLMVLDQGQLAALGEPGSVYSSLDEELQHSIHLPAAIRFSRAIRNAGGPALSGVTVDEIGEQLRDFPLNGHGNRQRPALSNSAPPETAIELRQVSFRYHDAGDIILRDISRMIPEGQFVALVGDNGAGKSTLARHLIGILHPNSGQVRVNDRDTAGRSIGQIAREVGFAFQNPELQIFNPTVRDEIAFGPRNRGLSGTTLDGIVQETMEMFGLSDMADLPPAILSFSARRMVALASIEAMQTPILVLDEPTVGLDASGQERVMKWLDQRHRDRATILLITHDVELAAGAERVIVLEGGRISADGQPGEVFGQTPILEETGLEAPFAMQLATQLGIDWLPEHPTPEESAKRWMEGAQR